MIKIAVVEDDSFAAEALKSNIYEYAKSKNLTIDVSIFDSGTAFIQSYKADTDIVFMDINMPNMSGLEAAQRLRKMDETAILIFVTDLVQYAVQGYSVSALDYLIKPVTFAGISLVLGKAQRILSCRNHPQIVVKFKGGFKRIPASQILFVEVRGHRLIYHTEDGVFESWGSLDSLEKTLPKSEFCRCNVAFLVSLRHIKTIENGDCVVGSDRLKISRAKKKEFLSQAAAYLGKSV